MEGCVVHVLLCIAGRLCCCYFVAAECGRYGPSCVQKLWSG